MGMNTPALRRTFEGALAYQRPASEELYLLVANQLFSGDTFYERQSDTLHRFQQLVGQVARQPKGPRFLLGLARYARETLYLRTTPTMLVTEAFLLGLPVAHQMAQAVWIRGDEHLEALAYVQRLGAKYPKQLLKAIARRLNTLTERQALRYAAAGKGKLFSQRDALRITHARPKDPKQAALFRHLTQGWQALSDQERALLPLTTQVHTGSRVVSWEQLLSKRDSTSETWAKAVPQMGYMALLRNLRNIAGAQVSPEIVEQVAARIADPEEVRSSKQFPYRFYSAYNALLKSQYGRRRARVPRYESIRYYVRRRLQLPAPGLSAMQSALQRLGVEVPRPTLQTISVPVPEHKIVQVGWQWRNAWTFCPPQPSKRKRPKVLLRAVQEAMEVSARSIAPLEGTTVIFVDLSGSMYDPVSKHSVITRMEAACTLAGLLGRQEGCEVYAFGSSYTKVGFAGIDNALQAAEHIRKLENQVGGGTYLKPAFEEAFQSEFDRIIVLTDEQVADNAWANLRYYLDYRKQCQAYIINLAGYAPSFTGQRTAKHPRVTSVGGFSERVLDWITALERQDPVQAILELAS